MDDRPPRLTIGGGALAGGIAGVIVGFADGVRAALLMGGGLRVALAAGVLAASVDAVLGVGAGAAVELVARAAVWGRRVRPPLWARRRCIRARRAWGRPGGPRAWSWRPRCATTASLPPG